VRLFLALTENNEIVGRIALILDRAHNEFHAEDTGFFGMFESIDNQEVADALLNAALNWSRSKGLQKLVGPMNLSTNHECGLLVEGFDLPPTIGIPYTPPYYPDLFRRWGLVKAKDLLSLKLDIKRAIPDYMHEAALKIRNRKRSRFVIRPLRLDQFDREVGIIWEVYNSAWERNWGFVPMSRGEFNFAVQGMKPVVQPHLCLIAEVKNEPAAFALAVPDINQILKHLNGRLFPFGWFRFYRDKKKIDTYRVLTLGVKKKYRRLGIDMVMYHELYTQFKKQNTEWCEMSWILEDNLPILTPLYRMGGFVYKRHRIYERAIDN
ncbi:MAG: hypothetical protein ACE5GQ_01370, partial [Nitrospinales bacterium]